MKQYICLLRIQRHRKNFGKMNPCVLLLEKNRVRNMFHVNPTFMSANFPLKTTMKFIIKKNHELIRGIWRYAFAILCILILSVEYSFEKVFFIIPKERELAYQKSIEEEKNIIDRKDTNIVDNRKENVGFLGERCKDGLFNYHYSCSR